MFGHHHLSAGQLLRDEIEKKSEIGLIIENTMNEGNIVPSHITVLSFVMHVFVCYYAILYYVCITFQSINHNHAQRCP